MNLKIPALCGIVGPILYMFLVLVLGSLTPGYSHITNIMSELGATGAPYAPLMNVFGFGLLGMFTIAFSFGLHKGLKKGPVLGPALLAFSGLLLITVGLFPCDPGCADITLTGTMHSYIAIATGIVMIFSVLILLPRIKGDKNWKGYFPFTLIMLVITVAFSLVYFLLGGSPWEGMLQRLSMAAPLFWVEVLANRLLRLTKP